MLTRVMYSPRIEIPKLASVLLIIPTLTFVQYVGMLINAHQILDKILWKCRSSIPYEDLHLQRRLCQMRQIHQKTRTWLKAWRTGQHARTHRFAMLQDSVS